MGGGVRDCGGKCGMRATGAYGATAYTAATKVYKRWGQNKRVGTQLRGASTKATVQRAILNNESPPCEYQDEGTCEGAMKSACGVDDAGMLSL